MTAAVIDASALVETLLRTPRAAAVRAAIGGHELTAPECIDPETLQSLRGLERSRQVSASRAALAVHRLREAAITRVPHVRLIDAAWELGHNISAYDAMYVALARELDCPLVTLDRRIAAAPDLGVTVLVPGG